MMNLKRCGLNKVNKTVQCSYSPDIKNQVFGGRLVSFDTNRQVLTAIDKYIQINDLKTNKILSKN